MRLLLVFVACVACAPAAWAHGGQFGHARRPSPTHVPSIACVCGRVDCPACSSAGLGGGEGLSRREVTTEVLETWGDLVRVRTTLHFAAAEEHQFLEASVRVEEPTALAVVVGEVTCVEHVLRGVLTPSLTARRDYLWERDTHLRDPMLVLPEGPGRVAVRVFPISHRGTTTATLWGFAVRPLPGGEPRCYRTGEEFRVVAPRARAGLRDDDLVDAASGVGLRFLSASEMRWFHPALARQAVEVPCVPALRCAVRGRGGSAVNRATALVALPRTAHAPANLFVGPAADAPLLADPLALREPSDPLPPPPPPPSPPPEAPRSRPASPRGGVEPAP